MEEKPKFILVCFTSERVMCKMSSRRDELDSFEFTAHLPGSVINAEFNVLGNIQQ